MKFIISQAEAVSLNTLAAAVYNNVPLALQKKMGDNDTYLFALANPGVKIGTPEEYFTYCSFGKEFTIVCDTSSMAVTVPAVVKFINVVAPAIMAMAPLFGMMKSAFGTMVEAGDVLKAETKKELHSKVAVTDVWTLDITPAENLPTFYIATAAVKLHVHDGKLFVNDDWITDNTFDGGLLVVEGNFLKVVKAVAEASL